MKKFGNGLEVYFSRASECILLVRFETHRERMVIFVYAILIDRGSWHFNMENSHGQEKSRD